MVETLEEKEDLRVEDIFYRHSVVKGLQVRVREEKEEEAKMCRICLCGEEEGEFLHIDCMCRGTMKCIHRECFKAQQLKHLTYRQQLDPNFIIVRPQSLMCEICKTHMNVPMELLKDTLLAQVKKYFRKVKFSWKCCVIFNVYENIRPFQRDYKQVFQKTLIVFLREHNQHTLNFGRSLANEIFFKDLTVSKT